MSPKPAAIQKESRLSIRASTPEKSLLRQAAQSRHMNTSEFVRQTSLDAARAILIEQTEFRLPPEQWEAFCTRLDEPAKFLPGLARLLSEPGPFHE